MGLRYLENVVTLQLNPELCVGCGLCLAVCPQAVFELRDKKAVLTDRDACMECGACALNCPSGALAVQAGVGCANAIINSALGFNATDCCCQADTRSLGGPPAKSTCC
jgi:NAD-dependent dihydropyrimidine dehydrogenase PreA subunit